MPVLAIETSTSSTKALLYDRDKGVLASSRESYGILHQKGQTDTEAVFALAMKNAERIARGKDVEAIALCGTWHSICGLDSSGSPVTPTYSWDYMDSANYAESLRRDPSLSEAFYRRTGCMPHNTYPSYTLGYLRTQGLDTARCRFATQGGYNFYRLTGCLRESRSTQSGSGLVNLETTDYDPFVLSWLGLDRNQLGELGTYRDTAPLSSAGAAMLGLKAGIPVIPAYPDGALNQLGSFAGRPGIMTMSVGTSGALRLTAPQPVLPAGGELWCYLGAEGVVSGAAVAGACNCVDWFQKKLLKGRLSFEELEGTGIGSRDIPVFLPFLYGERCPGWQGKRRGGFLQMEGCHDLSDMYHGIQAGVLLNMWQCYDILCRQNGIPREVLLSGGILNSVHWTQMAADILEREILAVVCPDASTMGAVALGLYTTGALDAVSDFRAEYDKAIRFLPDPGKQTFYRHQKERYLNAYYESMTQTNKEAAKGEAV